jgi:hypothetical protein
VAAKKRAAAAAPARRADFGTSVDAFVAKQKGELRDVLVALRKLVEEAMPKATSAIKWGMPMYEVNGKMAAALRVTKSYVSLILAGDPASFKDPKGLLAEGVAKGGRHLNVATLADLPTKEVKAWLKIAAKK